MAKQHEIFVKGCQEHSDMTKDQAEQIWNLFEPFQGYGFNKAHAACYGRVAYQTAYMKANFPAEYMCAVLTAEAGDTEKIAEVIDECQRMNIPVLPPDINESFKDFTVLKQTDGDKIRFGLLTIKNLGEGIAEAIITERKTDGPFKTIDQLTRRVKNKDLNKKSLESLIKCGALDNLGERNLFLNNVDQLLTYARDSQKQHASGQTSLFGDQLNVPLPPLRLSPASPASSAEKLVWEKELLGLFVSGHPLRNYQTQLGLEQGLTAIKDISPQKSSIVKIGGIVTKVQKIVTKTGKPMLFSWLEDLTSKIEVVVFPGILEKNPAIWQENSVLVVKGKLNERDGSPKILCDEVKLLTNFA